MLTKMNVLIHVLFLTIAYSTSPVSGFPGQVSCQYLGNLQGKCGMHDMPVEHLPDTCNSFFFEGLIVDENNAISTQDSNDQVGTHAVKCCLEAINFFGVVQKLYAFFVASTHRWNLLLTGLQSEEKNYINNIKSLNKGIYLFYSHTGAIGWTCEIKEDYQRKTEAANLKAFTDKYSISGILLNNLDSDISEIMPININYTLNLALLIDEINKVSPNLEVGLLLPAAFVVDLTRWLDINTLKPKLQFIVIDFNGFNECTNKYHFGGIVPINGDGHTINNVFNKLPSYGITNKDKNKVIFRFLGQPVGADGRMFNCDVTYSKFCCDGSNGIHWCLDSDATYYAKGQLVKTNKFRGFLLTYIDFIDNSLACDCCSKEFPSYQYILDGFNNISYITYDSCDKFFSYGF